jgi:hypothetical protein
MAAAIAATPPDSASMLSSMLKALIKATIHSTDRPPVTSGASMNAVSRRFGTSHTHRAATPNSTASRNCHDSPRRSSVSPSSVKAVPPPSKIQSFADCDQMPGKYSRANSGMSGRAAGTLVAASRNSCPIANAPTTPSQIANPPPRGVGVVCTFRSPGWSISPQVKA